MTGVSGRESNLSAIFGRSFASLRDEAPVLAAIAVLGACLTFAAQMSPRLLGAQAQQGWPLVAATGALLLLQAPLGGLIIERVLRRETGNVGPVQDDIGRTLAVLGGLFAIALILGAPALIQLFMMQTMLRAQSVGDRGLATLLSSAASVATFILFLNWPLAPTALMERRRGLMDALSVSRSTLKGHRWLLIGVFLLIGIAFFIPESFVIFGNMAERMRAAQAGDIMSYRPGELAYMAAIGSLQSVVTTVFLAQFYLRLRNSAAGLPGGETAALFD